MILGRNPSEHLNREERAEPPSGGLGAALRADKGGTYGTAFVTTRAQSLGAPSFALDVASDEPARLA